MTNPGAAAAQLGAPAAVHFGLTVGMGLGDNDVHVWTARPERVADAQQVARCRAYLAPDERARMERFVFDRDRHHYLVAHALVRCALSRYEPSVPPAGWQFDVGRHGRPEVRDGVCELPLRFNLSHTRGLVAVAVCLERDIGVDVEHVRPRSFTLEVADHYFSAPEVAALEALVEAKRRDRFFTYWTLKESYIKARGLGLALPLDRFGFDIESDDGSRTRASLWTADELGDDATTWWFDARSHGSDHRLAIAVRTGGVAPALQIAALVPGSAA